MTRNTTTTDETETPKLHPVLAARLRFYMAEYDALWTRVYANSATIRSSLQSGDGAVAVSLHHQNVLLRKLAKVLQDERNAVYQEAQERGNGGLPAFIAAQHEIESELLRIKGEPLVIGEVVY